MAKLMSPLGPTRDFGGYRIRDFAQNLVNALILLRTKDRSLESHAAASGTGHIKAMVASLPCHNNWANGTGYVG